MTAMDIPLTIAAFLVLIAGGVYMIHRLNSAHAERIASYSYSRFLPGRPAAADRADAGTGPRTTSGMPQGVETETPHSTDEDPPTYETADGDPPVVGLAEVRIIAADPDTAQRVAQLLRRNFRCDEPRSYPAGADGQGTLLHLTVDTGHVVEEPSAESPWLTTSHTQAGRTHTDEPG
ncbi:hypothetical protein [Streptomyces sp. NPDC006132]|uniref:hypothetical protein n=1 Tax=Streptomyces sp. NPDC006132 TaxID=3156732 RepID=UPI00340B693D